MGNIVLCTSLRMDDEYCILENTAGIHESPLCVTVIAIRTSYTLSIFDLYVYFQGLNTLQVYV